MEQTVKEFYEEFYSDLLKAKAGGSFAKDEDYFTSLIFEYLAEVGEVNEPIIYSFRDNGIQMNGFEFSDDYSELRIFVSIFNNTDQIISISKTDIATAQSRAFNILRKALTNKIDSFSRVTDLHDLSANIFRHKAELKDVYITALTNGIVKDIDLVSQKLGDVNVSFNVWDTDRLFKCFTSGQAREPIVVNFMDFLGRPLPALRGGESDRTNVFVTIIPGKMLAQLYREYHDKLLERNVRAYLQRKSGVNKGILETIQSDPDMFLAYNNGITVTAAKVNLVEGSDQYSAEVQIKSIEDFQIVNGGQTTVSMFTALVDNTFEVDFPHIFIQMKLAVVESESDMDEIVPNISRFSNSQNKIQMADFASNDPYHRAMETISRNTWSPAKNGHKPVQWFFERARGQYASALNANPTPSKRKEFKEYHPLITKTDLSKVLISWEMDPKTVSLGAQKCFAKFMDNLGSGEKIIPNDQYFKNCISKTILFRKLEKIVLAQRFGGYKANIVAYTYYLLMLLTGRRIDLNYIWENQDITPALSRELTEMCKVVREYIVVTPNGGNISEFAKTKNCQEGIRSLKYTLSKEFVSELRESEAKDIMETQPNSTVALTPKEEEIVNRASKISADEWQTMGVWAKSGEKLNLYKRSFIFSMYSIKKRQKRPTVKQAALAYKIHQEAIDEGFRM